MSNRDGISNADQIFYGHGKVLLTGEYFILKNAKGLALPTLKGQSLEVRYARSFDPVLTWKSFDQQGNLWFESKFEFWQFKCLKSKPSQEDLFLQKILREARALNFHFLREEVDIFVETYLDFPNNWGLGSSSTLIYNIAQWAYVSPFELFFKTSLGSGYDIACCQSSGPIVFGREASRPSWFSVDFFPSFKDSLYFLPLGKKQLSRKAVEDFFKIKSSFIKESTLIGQITEKILECSELAYFNELINQHEKIISASLGLPRAKDLYFNDYWGEVKSLGAWGGDMVLVTSSRCFEETSQYFVQKGFGPLLEYDDLIFNSKQPFINSYSQTKTNECNL
jgi:mevalonate kinase